MLKYCMDKWAANEGKLREAIAKSTDHTSWSYETLVSLVVDKILNDGETDPYDGWSTSVHVIDDGDYQGTLLFLIHKDCYQPNESEYLVAYVGYGSCSVCDSLLSIQWSGEYCEESVPSEQQVKDYMTICRDIVRDMKHPFNTYMTMDEVEPLAG